ncbi:hypothetical protein O181_064133 [Austropuccinia psidii MF-1]|uniref:Retrovirus-related Pol polyprotein from transposon TNT 1-94 n=1 Tax=Austropuccinia psidii MF-1 TaxID=1389203 RepID=A0A9Q3EMH0_9BASI|nr:hypothetical protein [Austropuccinia psidii MF-1]
MCSWLSSNSGIGLSEHLCTYRKTFIVMNPHFFCNYQQLQISSDGRKRCLLKCTTSGRNLLTVSINTHLIAWRSKKQQTVSHSTTKAEYKSLSDAAKETSWLINLINEIQLTSLALKPILLNDNKGAIDLALCDANHSGFKTKHMDIKLHYIRELLKNGIMMLKHVSTMSMNADFLTKSSSATPSHSSVSEYLRFSIPSYSSDLMRIYIASILFLQSIVFLLYLLKKSN